VGIWQTGWGVIIAFFFALERPSRRFQPVGLGFQDLQGAAFRIATCLRTPKSRTRLVPTYSSTV